MLSKSQYAAVWEFLLGRMSEDDVVAALGVDVRLDAGHLPSPQRPTRSTGQNRRGRSDPADPSGAARAAHP